MAEEEPGSEATVYRTHGDLHVRAASKLTQKEKDHLMDLVRRRSPDPSIFDGDDAVVPFLFNVRASNSKVDSWYTWMSDSSLRNYAEDATDPGVQFQVSHNGAGSSGLFGGGEAGQVGFGRSLQGETVGSTKDRACLIDFYTIPGLQCGNMTSDQFIAGARAGIYADVSIGFTPGAMICNICNGDLLKRWDLAPDDPERCTHYPGLTYDVEKGRKVEKIQAIFRIDDGHLNEVSTVYDGATPGAGIVAVDMARIASARGELTDLDRTLLENTFRVRIAPEGRIYAVERTIDVATRKVATPDPKEENVEEEADKQPVPDAADTEENPTPDGETPTRVNFGRKAAIAANPTAEVEPMERLRAKYREEGLELGSNPYAVIEVLADTCIEQNSRLEALEKDAKDGRDHREGLLKSLDASVVRVFGAESATKSEHARYRRYAEGEDVVGIQTLIDDLEKRVAFEAGRRTREVATGEEPETPADRPARRRGRTRPDLVG